ncbi:MAG: FIST C-terminal domain-containing protein [Defluviitaleaceae bacterium]|nr:FIST C-terminal domain-containing protein [Defluviitaleaceae bacterium]
MIKTMVACTAEIIEADLAVQEILSQLNIEGGLLKNSIGIVTCHYEFVTSEIVKALCDALPFEIVGTVSSSQAALDCAGSLYMALTVITSDDTEFVTALTSTLAESPEAAIAETYKQAAAPRPEKPALILTFAPFMPQNTGDSYVQVLSEASGDVPCFGTLAIDDSADFSGCFVFGKGEHYLDRMSMVLVYGELSPKFYIANVPPENIMDKSAIITKSAGSVIMEVNGRSMDTFFTDMGLMEATEIPYAMLSLPFMIDYNDGAPKVSKNYIGKTPERYAICAGAIPEGSTLHIATLSKEDVIQTAGQVLDQMLRDMEGVSGMLIYSCVGRSMVLGADQYDEMNLISGKVAGKLPFMMASAGGEICPTQILGGKATNRFHNNAFIACLF